jgi:hypothetical protein
MLLPIHAPLIRLGNLFPDREVYAKCEFLAPSGCFKIRGAMHLLEHLSREGRTKQLVVPSMGNTALGPPWPVGFGNESLRHIVTASPFFAQERCHPDLFPTFFSEFVMGCAASLCSYRIEAKEKSPRMPSLAPAKFFGPRL